MTRILQLTVSITLSLAFLSAAHGQTPWDGWTRRSCSSFPSNGRIDGPAFDNSYFQGCTLSGAREDAVFIRNVDNFAIVDFDISNAGREGIKLSSSSGASSDNVYIVGNRITNVEGDGIACPQRHANGVVHRNVKIWNNRVVRSAVSNNGKKRHGIYNQCQDAEVIGNYVEDNRNGNGITMRSSGIVRGNRVRYLRNDLYPAPYGINYYSDHMVGPSRTLLIENNVIDYDSFTGNGNHEAIAILGAVNSPYHNQGSNGYVDTFIIRGNAVVSADGYDHIDIDNDWLDVIAEDNRVFSSYDAVPSDWTEGADRTGDDGNSPPAPGASVSASDEDGDNVAANVLDGDLSTRWSALGNEQFLEIRFPEISAVHAVHVAIFRGDERRQDFRLEAIAADGSRFGAQDYRSSGNTLDMEAYPFEVAGAQGIRLTGYGNSYNDWNSVTEIEADAGPTPIDVTVSASAHQSPNIPANVLDGDLSTRWSANGAGQFIELAFGSSQSVTAVHLSVFRGDTRVQDFTIEAIDSNGGLFGREDFSSSGATLELEPFSFEASDAYGIRITGFGNSSNQWNSITEVALDVLAGDRNVPVTLSSSSVQLTGRGEAGAARSGLEPALDSVAVGGCSSGGVGSPVAAFALAAFMLFRRRRGGARSG
ncbi:MAG: discoidin domain-containing protein [Myxococcota bacterium]